MKSLQTLDYDTRIPVASQQQRTSTYTRPRQGTRGRHGMLHETERTRVHVKARETLKKDSRQDKKGQRAELRVAGL